MNKSLEFFLRQIHIQGFLLLVPSSLLVGMYFLTPKTSQSPTYDDSGILIGSIGMFLMSLICCAIGILRNVNPKRQGATMLLYMSIALLAYALSQTNPWFRGIPIGGIVVGILWLAATFFSPST